MSISISKKMKIGILTFHTPINYGAVLQVYALQTYLKSKFPEAEIKVLDFKTQHHIDKYSLFVKFRRNVPLYLYHQSCVLMKFSALKKRKESFRKFVQEELNLTKRYISEDDLLTNIPQMDVYIVGSDQVFHPKSPYLRAYYLDFKKNHSVKVAYAPSFGMSEFTDEIGMKLHKHLMDFDALSCREKDGANFISRITHKSVPTVVDPTFLLTISQWSMMLVPPSHDDKYIFVYDLNGGKNLIHIANKIKQATGYKIICQTQKAHVFYNIDKQLYDTGPREFVGLIKNAEFVVTDSFHGVAFSVFLRKKFLTYIATPKASSRIHSLLSSLGLQDRIIEYGQSGEFLFQDVFDLNYIDKLQRLVDDSEKYLLDSIKLVPKR